MPRKKTFGRRLVLIAFCAVFVCCLACPALAAGNISSMPGYVFVVSETFSESSFVADGEHYKVPAFTPSYKLEEADSCLVTYCGQSVELNWYAYSSDEYELLYYVGNASLIDSEVPNTGQDFFFALYKGQKEKSFFVCTADFYRDYVEGTGDAGFTISFSVPEPSQELTVPTLMDNIKTVFTSAISMVGKVAQTVSSNPILYLPIVIGLCGIGVAFFRRLKQ